MLEYFKSLGLWIIVDVVIVLVLILTCFLFFKKKKGLRLFFLLLAYGVCLYLVRTFSIIYDNSILLLSNEIFNYVNIFIIILFVTVYSADFKLLFAKISRPSKDDFLKGKNSSDEDLILAANEIVKAAQNMSKNDIGALIIVVKSTIPQHIIETGTPLDAILSGALLETIFNTNTPLHDGAVVISGNVIVSAGCFLPLSQDTSISKTLGTRHRAAMGISEESDVLVIVVSEESGIISTCEHGELRRYITPEKLSETIMAAFGIKQIKSEQ